MGEGGGMPGMMRPMMMGGMGGMQGGGMPGMMRPMMMGGMMGGPGKGMGGPMGGKGGMQPRPMGGPMQQRPPMGAPMAQQRPMGMPQASAASTLANAPPGMQKQMLGEKIFPMISRIHPEMAGKITGMMLEMDNSELLMLVESP